MSRVRVFSEHDVRTLLPMATCIALMEEALSALARNEAHQPLRQGFRPPGAGGLIGLMPSYLAGPRPLFGLKEVCVFPQNPSRGLDTHLGAVLVHSGETGELLAIANAAAITEIRTAAVSALATRLLAREDAVSLAIIGAGAQARAHMEAIPLVRPIREIRIASRTREKAEALAATHPRARAVRSVAEAVDGADVIVTATGSREPILMREDVAPGTHINAVGSSVATARELEGALVAASSLYVDRRESTINESGDYLGALREGAISEGHIRGEIGQLLLGDAAGRRNAEEITLFKSLGLGIEDLAAAAHLLKTAGGGTEVEI